MKQYRQKQSIQRFCAILFFSSWHTHTHNYQHTCSEAICFFFFFLVSLGKWQHKTKWKNVWYSQAAQGQNSWYWLEKHMGFEEIEYQVERVGHKNINTKLLIFWPLSISKTRHIYKIEKIHLTYCNSSSNSSVLWYSTFSNITSSVLIGTFEDILCLSTTPQIRELNYE